MCCCFFFDKGLDVIVHDRLRKVLRKGTSLAHSPQLIEIQRLSLLTIRATSVCAQKLTCTR